MDTSLLTGITCFCMLLLSLLEKHILPACRVGALHALTVAENAEEDPEAKRELPVPGLC